MPIIAHISGFSGSGKSYLCSSFKKKYKSKINIIDTDIWIDEFFNLYPAINDINKWSHQYNSFIKIKIDDVNNMKIKSVLCGILTMDFYTIKPKKTISINIIMPKNTKLYYIKIDLKDLFYQLNNRSLTQLCNNQKKISDDFKMGRLDILYGYFRFLDMDETKKQSETTYNDHKKLGYQLISSADISKNIETLLI